jgi:two-component system heavy metal sensor histidine kinase CusS
MTACSHSVGRRLSRKLAVLTMIVFGGMFFAMWMSIGMLVGEKNAEDLRARTALIRDIIELEARAGGEAAVLARLRADAPMRASTRLELHYADGQPVTSIRPVERMRCRVTRAARPSPSRCPKARPCRPATRWTSPAMRRMGNKWAWVLVSLTLAAGAFVAVATRWNVQRQLRPLHELAAQTRAISPRRLDQRLSLPTRARNCCPGSSSSTR